LSRKNNGYDGFGIAMIPEPSVGLLVTFGLIRLAGWRMVPKLRPRKTIPKSSG